MKNKILGYVTGFALILAVAGMSFAAWGPFQFNWPNSTFIGGPLVVTNSMAGGFVVDVGVAAGTVTIDLSAGNKHRLLMPAGNTTVAFSNPWVGQEFTLAIQQDGTGSRTVTWPSNVKLSGGALTLTTTASKTDTITFYVDANGNIYEQSRDLNE